MKIKYGKLIGITLHVARKSEYYIRVLLTLPDDYPQYPLGYYGGNGSPVMFETEGSFNAPNYTYISFIDSSNTLGTVVDGTSTGYFLWNPYKREEIAVLKEPVLRRYNPPRFSARRPVLRLPEEPIRRKGISEERWISILFSHDDAVKEANVAFDRRLSVYENKLNRWILKKRSYDAQYSRSVVRFKRKLNKYLERLTTLKGARIRRYRGDKRYAIGTEYSLFEIKGPVHLVGLWWFVHRAPGNEFAWVGRRETFHTSNGPPSYTAASLISATRFLSERYDASLRRYAMRKLKSGDVAGGVLLGESRETAELLISVARFLSHLRSDPRQTIRDITKLREVNSLYLAQNFGVRPLIDDLKRLVKLLGTGIQVSGEVKIKTGSRRSLDRQFIPLNGGFIVSGYVDIFRTYRYSISNPFYRILETLGLLNLPSIAWELVPLSFVFDWFYNVGDYMEAQTATSGLIPLEAWETLDIRGYASMGSAPPSIFTEGSLMPPTPIPVMPEAEAYGYQRVVSFNDAPIRLKVRSKISTELDPDLPHIQLGDWPLSKLVTSFSLILQRVLNLKR